ncbi:MAG: hypothetical protein Q8K48_04415 [Candidatus Planktophila sp.]|nr:hypothetical protein [Candidatus Planktophila sp.]
MKRKALVTAVIVSLIVVVGVSIQLNRTAKDTGALHGSDAPAVLVGGDLHTLTINNSEMIISGHESTAISNDSGKSWTAINALNNADIMAWATSSSMVLAGGHDGLYSLLPNENTFMRTDFYKELSDVHALGASGEYVYLATPEFGVFASSDGGRSWEARNSQIGKGFMGSMLVDPKNPMRVLAPDMQMGLLQSLDGGTTWETLGGPLGSMAIAWNPVNTNEITVIGMGESGTTFDAGKTWREISLPDGAAVVAYSSDGNSLFTGVLTEPPYAQVFKSTDSGGSWSTEIISSSTNDLGLGDAHTEEADAHTEEAMDPEMPGMDHSNPQVDETDADRPLKATLGTFGVATSIVLSGALILRRRDNNQRKNKIEARKGRGESL